MVDDGGPVSAGATAAQFRDRLNLTVLRQSNAGPAAARNAGARAATHEFIACTDDDCAPRPEWLAAFARAFGADPGALLGGKTVNALGENVYAAASQSLVDFLYAYYGADRGEAPFFTANNMALPRERFLALGGFDENFPLAAAEDREFGLRWRDRVGKLRYVPDAVVEHAHPLTLRRFWRQHANYGRGACHLARVARPRRSAQQRFEPPRFYLGLIARPVVQSRSAASVPESALLILSQIAMTWGYVHELRRERVGLVRERR